jgi:N-acetylmuramoyl-L-alanine amidase
MPAIGQQIVDVAVPHVGEAYSFGILVPKDNPQWTGPWDCAEFASWAVFQVSSILYGCNNDGGSPSIADAFTGYWQNDANRLGIIVTVDQAAQVPGAAVLRLAQAGLGGHIVISDGNGGTVEAHSTADGVIRAKLANRRWDMGILVPGINYVSPAANPDRIPQPALVYRLTMPNMKGPMVTAIQNSLASSGFNPGIQDGKYGPHTTAAVVAFQRTQNLVPDGEVGSATATALGLSLKRRMIRKT